MTIVAVITEHFNVYCEESNSPAFAHIWVVAVECVAVSIAMYCLIQFYVQVRDDISEYRPFLKILAIKLVIFLSFWQSIVITLLYSAGVIKATKKIAALDFKVGLPNLLISIEMALFAILHIWAFSWKPYSVGRVATAEVTDFYGNGKMTYHGGRFGEKAFIDALNPLDLLKAIGRGFRWLFVGRKRRTMDPSYHVPEAIGLGNADTPGENGSTSYQGAGGAMMTGGRPDRYGSSPDEEGEVLLSHPQPTGYGPHGGDVWLTPSPYEEDEHNGRFYSPNNRLSGHSMLEPTSHSPRPYSPYDDLNNPYLVPSDHGDDMHHHDLDQPHAQETGVVYPTHSLQEQVPIPMPESYQPPPLYDDDHHVRR
ncbi:hypothetical protein MW887_007111 [Aspergillus wentii]|nr:hypothetical protein MW887_007111 [Aspergillus wentii]